MESSPRDVRITLHLFMKTYKPTSDSTYHLPFYNFFSLYVHGGRDLREGSIGDMWRLDLDSLLRATEDPAYPVHWEQIQYKGAKTPGRISHHKCAVQGDKMILLGGNRAGAETGQAETWIFDLKNNQWESAKLTVRPPL
jgi:hypothetical protein